MNKEINKLIEQKHTLIRRLDFLEDKISELTNIRKVSIYKKNKEQKKL